MFSFLPTCSCAPVAAPASATSRADTSGREQSLATSARAGPKSARIRPSKDYLMRPATTRSCCPNADCEDAPIRRRRVVMTSRWLMGRHVVGNNHAAITSMHPRCLGKGAISRYGSNGTALAISRSSCHSQLRYSGHWHLDENAISRPTRSSTRVGCLIDRALR